MLLPALMREISDNLLRCATQISGMTVKCKLLIYLNRKKDVQYFPCVYRKRQIS